MSKLEDLIRVYCPNGVRYSKIKDVYTRLKGTSITAAKMKEISNEKGNIRIFAGGKTVIDAFEADIEKANITRVPAVLVQSRGVIDVVYYDKPFTFKNEMWAYTKEDSIEVKFLYYVLKNNLKFFRDTASSMGSLPQISLRATEDFEIPVPPLAVQKEIVRILDKFTGLTAELTAELAARKKQYEYYLHGLLLNNSLSVPMELSTVGHVRMCKRILKAQTSCEGDIPFYKIGTFGKTADAFIDIETFEQLKVKYSYPKKGEILISAAGTIGRTVIFDGEPAYFQDSNIVWIENDESKVLNKYLYYCYQLSPWKSSDGGTISRLYNDDIRKAKINVPPISEQMRIITILDKFDSLIRSISEGLPAEISARQKQYEYYRSKLLNFDKG